ncbi:glycosyltransferase family 4 protein [Mesorhizobium sp. BAC0120]|uniref:glycosyltransferase family 4 protein n=1 Tax=Mesorhizobium sp. BAC0120 TaxID=3090670 RepID=UPI00298CCCBD|nr:glycosyltransferase family 4 protein [Mesorhizobium sp. BAC0120]MDW6020971.1 glycosyltransferase family 4 protein [Mesorhizobium sp. BAC0120]
MTSPERLGCRDGLKTRAVGQAAGAGRAPKLLFVVTEDWYFVSHRLQLAVAASRAGYDVTVATRAGRFSELIREKGLKLCPIDFNRSGTGPVEEIRTLASLIKLYRRERPDIVHHVALKPVIYGSIAARAARISGVVNALGGFGYVFSSEGAKAKILRLIAKPALRFALRGSNARLIVQNGDDLQRVVSGQLADADTVRLIRGAGVDPDSYGAANFAAEPPLVILPARLLREKGVGEFVAAASLLRKRGTKARFALVGQPDPANPASVTQEEVDAWVREGAVEYWGWQDDMPAVLSQAQIVCLPTYHEGFPKSLLEAAASRCAIVATDIPGCREIVKHGSTGWLVPPRNASALADALHEAIKHPELRSRYGSAAFDLVKSSFSLDRIVSETLEIYDELLAAHDVALAPGASFNRPNSHDRNVLPPR